MKKHYSENRSIEIVQNINAQIFHVQLDNISSSNSY